jgi:N,N'-diacetylchitobiose phosphorylase
MQFGYFDDKNKEYVITRPDTPKSWSNYLGSTDYGALITNNAGGFSFFKSAAQGRFMRFRSNALPMDQPGRYIYFHDNDSKDYWSASWQPVGKPLDTYKTECRHGTAYTQITSEYSAITSETTYFVPLNREFECWVVKVKNNDKKKRNLSAFSFVEYANFWHIWQDIINLQYTQYITTMKVVDHIIDHGINVFLPVVRGDFMNETQSHHTFLAMAGAEVNGFDTDREKFIGPYRVYNNPQVVENGKCTNYIAVGDNACGTLQTNLELGPGEEKQFIILMGIGEAQVEGKAAQKEFSDPKTVWQEFDKVKAYWHGRIQGMMVETPDPEFNSQINMWAPFNCLITYAWSRAVSLVYSGERDGLGYRDTVQDLLGVLPTIPQEAGQRLELMITGQVSTGGAMPVVKPFDHHPGNEPMPDEKEYRSDDCMWLFNTVPAYVKETGNIEFFNKVLPYSDKGKDTVLGHLKQAISFSLERSGVHGLPCGLKADWNDCLVLGHQGETVFVALQLRYALVTYIEICEMLHKPDEVKWAKENLKVLDGNIEKHTWDGEWYLRAYRHDGLKFGSKENEEGTIWLNPQSWAVISGHADAPRAEVVMKSVKEKLSTDYGLMICAPPFEKADLNVVKATLFNKGMKENGAIFSHTQGWAIIAETILGHGKQAYEYFHSYMPAAFNNKAEIREIEPYVYCQSTHSKYSPHYGASRLPWLSGAATWSYYTATNYILGIRPDYTGLIIDPCIPPDWKTLKVTRRFRNKNFNISIVNENGVEKGVKKLTFNGKELKGNFILQDLMEDNNEVVVVMG